MKRFVLTLSLLTLSSSASVSHAGPVIDDILLQKVEVAVKTDAPADYFIVLARAADVNFIADSTRLFKPPFVPVGKQPPRDVLLDAMVYFAQEQRLSHLRYDARTFLFWPEPDVVALAKPIVEGRGVQPEGKVPTTPEMAGALADYFKRERGWDGQSADAGIRLHLSDLPLTLRQQVESYALNEVLNRERDTQLWLTDEFWENVRLQSGRGRDDNSERLIAIGPAGQNTNRLVNRYISFPPLSKP